MIYTQVFRCIACKKISWFRKVEYKLYGLVRCLNCNAVLTEAGLEPFFSLSTILQKIVNEKHTLDT